MNHVLLFAVLFAAPPATAQESFDLTIDGQRHEIRLGEAVNLPRVGTIRLDRREFQTFRWRGARFDYPSSWQVTEDGDELMVEPTGNAFIQLVRLPPPVSDRTMRSVRDTVVARFGELLQGRGAQALSDERVKVALLGKPREGVRLRFVALEEKLTTDIVVLASGSGGWVVLFHAGDEERGEAEKGFARFRDTFALEE